MTMTEGRSQHVEWRNSRSYPLYPCSYVLRNGERACSGTESQSFRTSMKITNLRKHFICHSRRHADYFYATPCPKLVRRAQLMILETCSTGVVAKYLTFTELNFRRIKSYPASGKTPIYRTRSPTAADTHFTVHILFSLNIWPERRHEPCLFMRSSAKEA